MSAPLPRPAEAERAAGVVTRVLAAAVDLGVVLVLMGLVLVTAAGLRFAAAPVSFRWPSPSWPLSVAVGAALATGYLAIAWAVTGRSAGGAVLGVRVRASGGGPLGGARAALRAALCVVFPLGLLWCALSRHRHSVQDVVVGSAVVYDRPPVHPARMGRAAPPPEHGGPPSAKEASP
jgi:hypothetical protein